MDPLVLDDAVVRCNVGNRNLLRSLGRNVEQQKGRNQLENWSMVDVLLWPCCLCLDYCLGIGRDRDMFDG